MTRSCERALLAPIFIAFGCFSPNREPLEETAVSTESRATGADPVTGSEASTLSASSTGSVGEGETTEGEPLVETGSMGSGTDPAADSIDEGETTEGKEGGPAANESSSGFGDSTAGACSQPCNPDPQHCLGSCFDGSCVVEAADMDGDGFGSSLCDVAPGDDCNDEQPSIFPGASEQCDGIDADCDGLDDIEEDGQELGGEVVQIESSAFVDKAIVYSDDLGLFGFVYSTVRDNTPAQRFVSIHENGVVSAESEIAPSLASFGSLAAGHDGFGYAYILQGVRFRRLDGEGNTIGEEETVAPSATGLGRTSIIGTPNGWVVAWRQDDTVRARRIQSDGTPTGEPVDVGTADAAYAGPDIGLADERLLIAFANVNNGVQVRPYSFELIAATDARPIAPAPALNPTLSGNGVVFTDGGFVRFGLLNPDGTYICGPVTVSTELSSRFDADSAAAPAEYPGGHLVGYVDGVQGGRVVLARIHEACEVQELRSLVHDTGRQQGHVELAAGSSLVVSAWREPSLPAGYYRTFGINLCTENF